MITIGIVGLSVRDHDAATLARFTIERDRRATRLPDLAAALGVRELVYLATCNRVELVYRRGSNARERIETAGAELRRAAFAALAGRDPVGDEAARTFRHRTGEAAVEHLFRVAAGLDSTLLGERDIQGQLRDALDLAKAAGTAGPRLAQLVDEALRVARDIHRRTQLGAGKLSLAEIAVDHLLERVRRTPSEVALLGVSAMTRRAAEILQRERIPFVVANRTVAHAEALVAELGFGRALSLDDFRLRPPRVEAVLTATGAGGAILDRAALERLAAHTESQEPPLLVDLATPPDVEPETARAAQVPRVGIDQVHGVALGRRQGREAESAAAGQLIEEALAGLRRRLAERRLAPVIARIHRRFRETALEGVERLLAKRGRALEATEREALERWAETLARRFAHLPTLGLRALAAEHGMTAVKSFLAACDAEALAELAAGEGDDADLERLAEAFEEELRR